MRPEALGEARDWLARADRDLLVVELTLSASRPLLEQAAFHSQQAAEKALKAYLAAHDQPFPKTHNLERLVAMCQRIDNGFASLGASAKTLTPYATRFRYPGGQLEPDPGDANEAFRLARVFVQFARERIGI